jgi:hypothetical protein
MYTFEQPLRGTCRRIDLGCLMGWAVVGRGVEVGVDFEEETVEEEIVIALPEEGGMRGLEAGVVAVEVGSALETGGGALGVVMVADEDRGGSGTRGGCSAIEDGGLSCACGGGRWTVTSSWTGFRMSSMWLRFLGVAAGVVAFACCADSGV